MTENGRGHPAVPGRGRSGATGAWADPQLYTKKREKFGEKNMAFDGGPFSDRMVVSQTTGTSVFDPTLCELCYRWFCPPGGVVLDPFAGGSVRGIVASRLGRKYVGVDLSAEQIAANRIQADAICGEPKPKWIEGDAVNLGKLVKNCRADFVFSCPPYYDLEIYSDDPRDLSNMKSYGDFRQAYAEIIRQAAAVLAEDRFACFVVGDVRDKEGLYRCFPWHTVEAFTDAGLGLYNEAVLVTAVGSLSVRAGRQFASSRKFGKTHQNVLVFCKGDWRKAAEAVGPVEFGEVSEDEGGDAEFGERLVLGGEL